MKHFGILCLTRSQKRKDRPHTSYMGGGGRRSPPPAARENHVIRWLAERGGDREGIGATAPESANHRITWFSPATGRGARLSPPPYLRVRGDLFKVWAKRRIFDFFLSIIMYDHPQKVPLWNSPCVKYSFRTYSFYRPEKMVNINFLVVCYILKRIMSIYIIRSAPLGDIIYIYRGDSVLDSTNPPGN